MFFNIKKMEALGFGVPYPHSSSRQVCHHYRRLYPEQHAVLCFTEIQPLHGMMLFQLTPEQYATYLTGKLALPFFDNGHGRTADGYGYLQIKGEVINKPWNILKRTKELTDLIAQAEARLGLVVVTLA